jgi:hypothetical protein
MKTLIVLLSFFCIASTSFAQKQAISYEDLKYMIENNLGKTDTFLVSKGYTITKIDKKKNNRSYTVHLPGGTNSEVSVRADGKKIFIEIDTDDISQYNMIYNSIAQFVTANSAGQDIQTFNVKDLGTVYIHTADTVPYSPIRKDYDIHLVADKNIMSYN